MQHTPLMQSRKQDMDKFFVLEIMLAAPFMVSIIMLMYGQMLDKEDSDQKVVWMWIKINVFVCSFTISGAGLLNT